jgi:alcohol dehydrogenase YqhD (iron-dependent ADH family)
MQTFTFYNPTRIEFGSKSLEKLGDACQTYGQKVLVVLGQGSARKSGLLDRVLVSLAKNGLEAVLIEGVRPNPVLSKVEEGIALARKEKVDLLLAVGGGSVLDSAKAMAAGALYDGSVWDFFSGKATVKDALPLVTVLTLAATGSEMNGGAVVTHEALKLKSVFSSPHCNPRVSIMDPALTLDVPEDQTAFGVVDAFVHVMEPYLNHDDPRPLLQRELQEGVVRSLIDCGRRLTKEPRDLAARSDMMWAATMALNGVTSAGLGPAGWPLHMMEHSLSAITDVAHGAGLSALFTAWAAWKLQKDGPSCALEMRLGRLGRQVFSVDELDDTKAAQQCLNAIDNWFHSIGAPTSLGRAEVRNADLPEVASNAAAFAVAWGLPEYDEKAVLGILDMSKCYLSV